MDWTDNKVRIYQFGILYLLIMYSLRPEILVGEVDVSRRILVLDTSIFINFSDKYFWTEGVYY